jgi:uncharacterized membrane protein YtjA (UPF0391 family)
VLIGAPLFALPFSYERAFKMWRWVIVFLLATFVAGIFAFAGLVVAAIAIAKLVFYLFLILFLAALIYALTRGLRSPKP